MDQAITMERASQEAGEEVNSGIGVRRKEESFQKTDEGFTCSICQRTLSTKQRVLSHLVSAHHLSPLKRKYKLYVDQSDAKIPDRTERRHRKRMKHLMPNIDQPVIASTSQREDSPIPSQEGSKDSALDLEQSLDILDGSSENSVSNLLEPFSDYDHSNSNIADVSCQRQSQTSETTSGSSDSDSDSLSSESETESESSRISLDQDQCESFAEQELTAISLFSFMIRHNLNVSCSKDLLCMLKALFPNSEKISSLTFSKIMALTSKSSESQYIVVHYCSICFAPFPDDASVFRCETRGCKGLRYKGSRSAQTNQNRRPNNFFLLGNVKNQLKDLLQRKNIWKQIVQNKTKAMSGNDRTAISDVIDGEMYKKLCQPGQFLSNQCNISGIFNTDGVPLYKSSNIKLWPIFIAVNEINIPVRFSRENTLLAGIWQGKGNPPFFHYLAKFGELMCTLYEEGVEVQPYGCNESVRVRLGVFLNTLDLQAKAYVSNMTMHNGNYGCITCEQPGETVRQGKGYSRYYPPGQKKLRNADEINFVIGPSATAKKRIKGICGTSGLIAMPWFDIVQGTLPDYMHGVLLGVVKTLLHKWLSSTESGQEYFVGRHLKTISMRLQNITPPDYVERLPRDLEKHYNHFKATELQSWLLFYGIPCLQGFLPDKYLNHFACLSEGMHLLLGDNISPDDLEKAENLLNKFYVDFADLYGKGSCGLNIHNVGSHLVYYVKKWGPPYAWSCFGFEDCNADILQFAHGTKDVTKQIMQNKATQLSLWATDVESISDGKVKEFLSNTISKQSKVWLDTKPFSNCSIAGKEQPYYCECADIRNFVLCKTGCSDMSDVKKLQVVSRIQIANQKFYCREYTKMKRRVCHVVLCNGNKIFSVDKYIVNQEKDSVFAFGKMLVPCDQCFLFAKGGHHLIRVTATNDVDVINVAEIKEKLFFIEVDKSKTYVARIPNMHGHGIFK